MGINMPVAVDKSLNRAKGKELVGIDWSLGC